MRAPLWRRAVAVTAALASVLIAAGAAVAAERNWLAAWSMAPERHFFDLPGNSCGPGFGMSDQTVRNVAFVHAGGDRVRIRLSNEFGTTPLRVGRASVAVAARGPAIRPRTLRRVLFGRRMPVVIPPGSDVLSDGVRLRVAPLSRLAVSVHVSGTSERPTVHALGYPSYVAPGDRVSDTLLPSAQRITCWMFTTGIDVQARPRFRGTVVALGDSLTDGYGKFAAPPVAKWAHATYPDLLARRLVRRRGRTLSVVNAGISGGRLLGDPVDGADESAESRLGRDALRQAGVTDVILLAGINDIGFGARAPDLIAGQRRMIARAHARGIRIYGGTLTPFRGSDQPRGHGEAGEAVRQAVNGWIRTGAPFDGVIDFDAALRDPDHLDRLRPRYDSGDHVHLSRAGFRRMAQIVPLRELIAP